MCIILYNMIIEDEQDMLKNLRYISKGDDSEIPRNAMNHREQGDAY
jgi:hypothetical protein